MNAQFFHTLQREADEVLAITIEKCKGKREEMMVLGLQLTQVLQEPRVLKHLDEKTLGAIAACAHIGFLQVSLGMEREKLQESGAI